MEALVWINMLEALRLEIRAAATLAALTAATGKIGPKSMAEGGTAENALREAADDHARVAKELA